MTTPDTVGGMPELPEPFGWYRAWLPDGTPVDEIIPGATKPADWPDRDCVPVFTPRVVRAYGELCRAAPAGGDVPWRCFHCDEVFTTGEAAALHFGTREYQSPACQIDVAAYREMEALQLRYLDEDADVHRAMYRMQGEHQQALRRAEEDGYAKGLRDSEKDSAPAGSGEVEGLADELEHMAETDYNTGCCNSDYPIAAASRLMRTAAALLRKLQQGADEVEALERNLVDAMNQVHRLDQSRQRWADRAVKIRRVYVEHRDMLSFMLENHATVETDGMGNWRVAYEWTSPPTYGPYAAGRYPAIEAAMIAASQGQEG